MSMPFDRYLVNPETNEGYNYGSSNNSGSTDTNGYSSSQSTSSGVQFQLPPFMYTGPPTLALGGGAEVLQPPLFSGEGNSWLSNTGFSHVAGAGQATDGSPNTTFNSTIDSFLRNPSDVPPFPSEMAPPWGPSASNVDAPSALGLPVYSASGFDLLGILGRVVNRPAPKIHLGPVDMTCSFVVTDTRRYDHPIVYASPTFCQLTGYSESEILGRNCRFLQAPDGRVVKGEERRYTSPDAVNLMRKSLMADKECQTSLVNYKKGGQAFINLVTVIPVGGGVHDSPEDRDQVCYQVGFQVDLTQQPNAILERLKDGSYMVNYSSGPTLAPSIRRPAMPNSSSYVPMSNDLRHLLSDPNFTASLPLTTNSNAIYTSEKTESYDDHELLNLLLLESLPDFIHVLSLKGVFLYVAPSVRRVLGYHPEELVGKSVADFCHPADLVPLMRELKESSSTPANMGPDDPAGGTVLTGPQSVQAVLVGPGPTGPPKTVDLLFRIRAKHGAYVWLDCRGRLHVEPGKGRKAIIMSGRRRAMPRLEWGSIGRAGGVVSVEPAVQLPSGTPQEDADGSGNTTPKPPAEREFWANLSASGTMLFVAAGARDVLGWGVGELIGRTLIDLVEGTEQRQALERALTAITRSGVNGYSTDDRDTESMNVELRRKDKQLIAVHIVLYRSKGDPLASTTSSPKADTTTGPSSLHAGSSPPAPVVVQVRLASAAPGGPRPQVLTHEAARGIFEEFETSRGTSWQYELQQLKYANRRLADEIASLEANAPPTPPTAEDGASGNDGWSQRGARPSLKRAWDDNQEVGG